MPVPRPDRIGARLSSLSSYALLGGGAAVMAFMAYSVYLVYTPLLWVDQWIFLQELVSRRGSYGLDLIWRQHNDHRIPIPKLFYLADLFWFGGRNLLLLGVIFAIQLTHAAWLAVICRSLGGLTGAQWRFAVALALICLFSMRQAENFWFGSDLPMVIPYFACTVAVSSLAWSRGRVRYIAAAWVAASVASLSMSNGLFLWPLLILLMLAWRTPVRYTIATAAMAAALCAFWFTGYSMPLSQRSFDSLPRVAEYLLVLYGSSWSCIGERFGTVMAMVALPAVAIAFVWVLARRRSDVFALTMLSIASFAMLSTAVTALGRAGMGIEQARTDRYQTAAMLFWFSVAVLLIRQTARLSKPWVALLPAQAAMLAVFLAASQLGPQVADGARIHASSMRAARLALEAGVNHAAAINYVLVPPYRSDDVLLLAGYLRRRRWSIFEPRESAPLGRDIDRVYDLAPASACAGAVDPETIAVADPRWSGFRVSGWAYDRSADRPASAVVLVDAAGRLVGSGSTGFQRPGAPRAAGFITYIPPDLRTGQVTAYAILEDGVSACPLNRGNPLTLDLAAATYLGIEPTGVTRSLTKHKTPARMMLDALDTTIMANTPLTVRGWIVDPARRAGRAADIVVDGIPVAAGYGFERRDTTRIVAIRDDLRCGFEGTIPALAPGDHTITVRVVPRGEDIFFEAPAKRVVAR